MKVPGPIHLAYAAAVLRRRLGRNGPEVSLLGLGCNNFGQRVGLAETRDIVAAALDEGVTFFDTADLYGRTDSERYLGQALGPRRADVVIATKWGYTTLEGAPTRRGLGLRPKAVPRGSGRYIRWALDESLRRLGTDWIDVYQYHLLDEETPLEETFDALFEEIRAGKIRFVGLPTLDVPELEHAVATAERLGLPLASMQVHVNLIRRDAADTVLPAAERLGVGALPYLPLEGVCSPASTGATSRCPRTRATPACRCTGRESGGSRIRRSTGPKRSSSSPLRTASRYSRSRWAASRPCPPSRRSLPARRDRSR